MTQQNDFFPISSTGSRFQLTTACPPNLPAPGEFNWDYGKFQDANNSVRYYNCDSCDGYGSIYFQQPQRQRAILPRSWFGRPTAPPESATTYKCSFYRKCYSKRCPIWPRNHIYRSCAPPPRCTMNQLSYTYRLRHNMWY